ncbi:MAG: hypothetical protein KDD45_17850 [Bdellovibrionales bacterium]|nr:hypothetical protein [Bdellovibrionales bacterium]
MDIFEEHFEKEYENKKVEQSRLNFKGEYSGDKVVVVVIYNPEVVDLEYFYGNKLFSLRNQFKNFILNQLPQIKFNLEYPSSSLSIFDEKKYDYNKYTGTYLFDPFFESVNI